VPGEMDLLRRTARNIFAAVALVLSFSMTVGRAEEITLQDGKKLSGAIVGYENGMFKVETDFGYVLIKKDKVKSISFPPGAKIRDEAPKSEAAPPNPLAAPTAPAAVTEVSKAPPAPPPPVSRPLDQPLPSKISAKVEGTTYINETFAFTFYKPPGWKVHEDAPRETGRAIVAIGPEDEHTILFVERQVWSGEPDLKSDATEANLRTTYQNYRKLTESAVDVDGRPAIRKEFEGEMEGALWRGVALRVTRDKTVFGVIGLTSAETLQFHEAVLNKILKSFQFIRPSGTDHPPSPNP
jgi:hypothetical protein